MLLITLNNVGVLQTNFLTWCQTHKFLLGLLHKVVALNPKLASKLYGVGSISLVLRVVGSGKLLNLILGIVGDNNLDRVEYGADTDGATVQVVTNSALQEGHVVKSINLGVTNLIDELDDTFGAIATTAETTDCWHTGIVPTAYHIILYQCQQITL